MKGYWNSAESRTDAVVDEWFSTSDIGRVDQAGYFFFVARKKHLIIDLARSGLRPASPGGRLFPATSPGVGRC
jgi:long-chain acyl-CoA synthetase